MLPQAKPNKRYRKTAVYIEKGTLGKTHFSLEIALSKGFIYATNQNRPRKDIIKILPNGKEQFLQVAPDAAFPTLPDDTPIVFDLAGELVGYEESILSALRQVDLIIVPFIVTNDAIEAAAYTVTEISQEDDITADVLFVANMLEGDTEKQCQHAQERLSERIGYQVNVIPMRRSKAFEYILRDGIAVSDMIEGGGLMASTFKRSGLAEQLQHLLSYIHD